MPLKNQDDHSMLVEGHTDSQGTESTNMGSRSSARADRARPIRLARRPADEIISAMGIGQSRPVADNAIAEGRANNRRVEIIVQPD